jgi:hypothetical protein
MATTASNDNGIVEPLPATAQAQSGTAPGIILPELRCGEGKVKAGNVTEGMPIGTEGAAAPRGAPSTLATLRRAVTPGSRVHRRLS